MGALRISLETRGLESSAGVGRAASAAARLANVVRCARNLPAQPLVCQFARTTPAQRAGRDATPRAQSVSRRSTEVRSRPIIRVSFHNRGGTPSDRRLVEA